MKYFLLALSVMFGSFRSIASKGVKNFERGKSDLFFYNVFTFGVALIVVFLLSIAQLSSVFNGISVLLAVLYAIGTFAAQVFLTLATGSGSVSLSTLFYSCNFLIPTVFGTIYYHEPVHYLYFIGVALILLSFVLSVKPGGKGKINAKWLVLSLGGMVSSGFVGIIQKIYTNEFASASINGLLIISFAVIVLLNFVLFCTIGKRELQKMTETVESHKKRAAKGMMLSLVLGAIIGGQNILCFNVVKMFPSAVSFPVMNGGVILLTAAISAILLKEKLTLKQTVAILIGVMAIVCIGIGKFLIA